MKVLQRVVLPLFLFILWALCGFAQSRIIATYVGPGLPVSGEQAVAQSIDCPGGVVADGAGGFYVSSTSQNRVYRVDAAGSLILTAGVGSNGYNGDGGLATKAQLDHPYGVAVDSGGNVYIADVFNNRIRKVTPEGIISTVAGTGIKGFSGDGASATSANLDHPFGIAIDSAGNLYIADSWNERIRKVTTDGIINTVAGGGTGGLGDGGIATAARFANPVGVAIDSAGNLYIADFDGCRIRMVTTGGVISTVAGNGNIFSSGDGGLATAGGVSYPTAVAVNSAGNLFIAEYGYHRIRKVTAGGVISSVAGIGGTYGDYNGDDCLATVAKLSSPDGIAFDAAGNLYIADWGNNRIRKVATNGIVSTVAGTGSWSYSGDGGLATAARLSYPSRVAIY
jgi:sugar lactone lactonase YvrE